MYVVSHATNGNEMVSHSSTTCEGVCRQDFWDEALMEEELATALRVDLRGEGVAGGGGVSSAERPSGWPRVATMTYFEAWVMELYDEVFQ